MTIDNTFVFTGADIPNSTSSVGFDKPEVSITPLMLNRASSGGAENAAKQSAATLTVTEHPMEYGYTLDTKGFGTVSMAEGKVLWTLPEEVPSGSHTLSVTRHASNTTSYVLDVKDQEVPEVPEEPEVPDPTLSPWERWDGTADGVDYTDTTSSCITAWGDNCVLLETDIGGPDTTILQYTLATVDGNQIAFSKAYVPDPAGKPKVNNPFGAKFADDTDYLKMACFGVEHDKMVRFSLFKTGNADAPLIRGEVAQHGDMSVSQAVINPRSIAKFDVLGTWQATTEQSRVFTLPKFYRDKYIHFNLLLVNKTVKNCGGSTMNQRSIKYASADDIACFELHAIEGKEALLWYNATVEKAAESMFGSMAIVVCNAWNAMSMSTISKQEIENFYGFVLLESLEYSQNNRTLFAIYRTRKDGLVSYHYGLMHIEKTGTGKHSISYTWQGDIANPHSSGFRFDLGLSSIVRLSPHKFMGINNGKLAILDVENGLHITVREPAASTLPVGSTARSIDAICPTSTTNTTNMYAVGRLLHGDTVTDHIKGRILRSLPEAAAGA